MMDDLRNIVHRVNLDVCVCANVGVCFTFGSDVVFVARYQS